MPKTMYERIYERLVVPAEIGLLAALYLATALLVVAVRSGRAAERRAYGGPLPPRDRRYWGPHCAASAAIFLVTTSMLREAFKWSARGKGLVFLGKLFEFVVGLTVIGGLAMLFVTLIFYGWRAFRPKPPRRMSRL